MTKEEQIKIILQVFDFQKVRDYMISTNWTWGDGDMVVPSIEDLKEAAEDLLNTDNVIGSGGFFVIRIGDEIELLFSIESSYTKMMDFHYNITHKNIKP
jgi:hypothetical protein